MVRPALTLVVALTIVALTSAASAQPSAGAPSVATVPAASRPRYDAPAWVRERRHAATRRSRELLLREMQEPPMLGWPRATDRTRTPAEVVAFSLRRVEDIEDFAALQEGAARELDEQRTSNRDHAASLARQRAELLTEAARLREAAVSTGRVALDRAPEAPHADELLFRMAGLLAVLGREDEARAAFDVVLARHPTSPFAPHVRLDAGERAFARGEWAAAAVAYERASLPASADNRVRAYALYRLAWARALAGEPDVALVHFDQALAWAAEHPDAPDVDGLAEVARQERAALAARVTAPQATRTPHRRPAMVRAPGRACRPARPPTW